jgi:hypothetical protein
MKQNNLLLPSSSSSSSSISLDLSQAQMDHSVWKFVFCVHYKDEPINYV